jgi:hypothetical protein
VILRGGEYGESGDMQYIDRPSVQVSSWAGVDDDVEISYLVLPTEDTIELTLGSQGELEMRMSEAGLRHCLTGFTRALEAFEAAAASAPEDIDGEPPAAGSDRSGMGGGGEPGDGP